MASFRYDHLVHQLSDFTDNQDQIEKSFDIVKTTVYMGDVRD